MAFGGGALRYLCRSHFLLLDHDFLNFDVILKSANQLE